VHGKTGGNPFFAIQFVTALADEGLLAFDSAALTWHWDIERIRAKNYTDNVVELMAVKLKRFSTTTQETLQQLACLGNVVDAGTLALALREPEEAIVGALLEAVHAGLVFRHENAYKFLHDRIQQAAYSLIPAEHRAGIHLRIGRALLAGMTEDELAEHLFDVANQLDRGAERLVEPDEKARAAAIDLRAGRKAKASAAYESARASGAAGPYLHRLFQRAFRTAKQVRTHTDITRGSVSVGSVAVDLAEKIFGRLSGRKVLVLGAGETSERTARALVSQGVSDLRVSNRSMDRAAELARLVDGSAIRFDEWPEQCREIDILITSTSSETPLLTPENLAPMLRDRIDRPLFIIDIAVPRDVDPGVNEMEGVYLYDIDSLQSVAQQSLALRRQQIAAAEAIIAEHVADFWESVECGTARRCADSNHSAISENPVRASEL